MTMLAWQERGCALSSLVVVVVVMTDGDVFCTCSKKNWITEMRQKWEWDAWMDWRFSRGGRRGTDPPLAQKQRCHFHMT